MFQIHESRGKADDSIQSHEGNYLVISSKMTSGVGAAGSAGFSLAASFVWKPNKFFYQILFAIETQIAVLCFN